MLFQGQEFSSTSPFFFFADHQPELAAKVRVGRHEFLKQFASLADPEAVSHVPDPDALETFERCKLKADERRNHVEAMALHRDLLRLRHEDVVFRAPKRRGVDGAVLGLEAFVLRFFADDGADRLLIVNLGSDLKLGIAPEPLLAPPEGMSWQMLWSSEAWEYGGSGHAALENEHENWRLPGEAAVVLTARLTVPPTGP